MNARHTWLALALGCLGLAALTAGLFPTLANAQKARIDPRFEYKVVHLTYNPGERLNDDARATRFERLLNDYAREGWEPVSELLSRTNVQTIGGGVTTRDTISFVAFRRPR